MKILFGVFLISSLALTGCYTVLWTPDQEFTSESEYYGGGSYSDGYYSDPYYGGYEYYYERPWWVDMRPPTKSSTDEVRTERSEEIRKIRNNDSGRNENTPRLNSPTRTSTPGSDNSGNTGSTTSSTTETRKNDNTNSGSNSSDNRNQSRSSGDRNSGGGRR